MVPSAATLPGHSVAFRPSTPRSCHVSYLHQHTDQYISMPAAPALHTQFEYTCWRKPCAVLIRDPGPEIPKNEKRKKMWRLARYDTYLEFAMNSGVLTNCAATAPWKHTHAAVAFTPLCAARHFCHASTHLNFSALRSRIVEGFLHLVDRRARIPGGETPRKLPSVVIGGICRVPLVMEAEHGVSQRDCLGGWHMLGHEGGDVVRVDVGRQRPLQPAGALSKL
jgi:hypothetical protein